MPKPVSNDLEVVASPERDRRQRRRFTAEQRARILAEADQCTERGQLGVLMRREGIYSSQLSKWRARRAQEGATGLANQRPGRKPVKDAKDRLIEKQGKQIERLERETRIQKGLIELQRKAHEILGVALPRIEDNENGGSSSSSDSAPGRFR